MKILDSKIRKIIREEISLYLLESTSSWSGNEDVARLSADGDIITAIGAFPVFPASYGGDLRQRERAAREAAISLAAGKIIDKLSADQKCVSRYCVVSEGSEQREYNGVMFDHIVVILQVREEDILAADSASVGRETAEENE